MLGIYDHCGVAISKCGTMPFCRGRFVGDYIHRCGQLWAILYGAVLGQYAGFAAHPDAKALTVIYSIHYAKQSARVLGTYWHLAMA